MCTRTRRTSPRMHHLSKTERTGYTGPQTRKARHAPLARVCNDRLTLSETALVVGIGSSTYSPSSRSGRADL